MSKNKDPKKETSGSNKIEAFKRKCIKLGGPNIFDRTSFIRSWGLKKMDDRLGGLPAHLVLIVGPEGSGKTSISLTAIAHEQKTTGKPCAYIGAEQSLNIELAKAYGVDTDKLLILRPTYPIMETVLELVYGALKLNIGIVVVDSLPALIPSISYDTTVKQEDWSKRLYSARAAILSEKIPFLVAEAVKNNNTLIILNQIREKVGLVFGNPETWPGGHALRHGPLQTIKMYPKKKIYEKSENDDELSDEQKKKKPIIGKFIEVIATHNKIAPPERVIELELIYGKGFKE
jgi:recombination protein RecA